MGGRVGYNFYCTANIFTINFFNAYSHTEITCSLSLYVHSVCGLPRAIFVCYGLENSLWADQMAIPPCCSACFTSLFVVFSKELLSWAFPLSAVRMPHPRVCPVPGTFLRSLELPWSTEHLPEVVRRGRGSRGVSSSVCTQSCSCPKWAGANGGYDTGHSHHPILGP